jgi:pentatricopeptide repeat protein
MQTQQQPQQHLLQEPAYTSLIRVCGARGDVAEGKRLLSEMQALPMSAKATPRLRTFLPLLEACVAAGDTEGAFEMYDLIRAPPLPPGGGGGGVVVGGGGLMVGEREYVLLLKAATAGGNVEKANLVLRSLAEDVLRPSKTNTWPAIEAWFKSPAAQTSSSGGTSSGPWKWKVLRGVAGAVVDPATGACLDGSGCVLQSVDLSSTQKRRMLAQVLTTSTCLVGVGVMHVKEMLRGGEGCIGCIGGGGGRVVA